jgi:hypothetical protein
VGQAIVPAAAFQAAFEPGQTPEQFVRRRGSRLKADCTVESLVLAGKPHVGQDGILLPIGNRPLRVFIPFHGPKAHADRQDWLPRESAKAKRPAEAGCRLNACPTKEGRQD